jgi:anaerobic ribonucleoside-triphosphate reductase
MNKVKVPVECWTRCVGFFRPISQFNPGKKEEFKERKAYKVPKDLYVHGKP